MGLRIVVREALRYARILSAGARRSDFLSILPKDSVGAEVGVFRGAFSGSILRVVEPKELHLIDGWNLLYGERFPNWGWYTRWGGLTTAQALDEVRAVVERYDRKQACRIHAADDLACLSEFPSGHFDWVYLDSAHDYEHTRRALQTVQDKIKPDGFITGHDWREDPAYLHHGVYRAVAEFCAEQGWAVVKLDDFTQWAIRRTARG